MTPQRLQRINNVLTKRQKNITVVLENIEDPHNISAVLRTCDAVGISTVYVVNTRIPKHQKFGVKSSSSAAQWLNVVQYTNSEEAVFEIKKNHTTLLAAYLDDHAVSLYDIDLCDNIALVFGNETHGISPELKQKCDGCFQIPQVGMVKSLNISVACAVTLYEAFRQKNRAGHYALPQLNSAEQAHLLHQWQG